MDLEDLSVRYREIKLWQRLLVLTVLAVSPGAYDFWDRYETLVNDRKAAEDEKLAQEDKLKYALEKHVKLAKLEDQLIIKEKEIKEVAKKFPDEIPMDRVLQKTELIAQQLGLTLKLFKPKEEIPSETAFKYLKLPIGLQLVGTYGQIANFFDHIVHLDFLVNIENVDLAVDNPKDEPLKDILSPEKKRSQMRLRAACDMSVFRSLTERESKALATIYENKRLAEKAQEDAANAAANPQIPGISPPGEMPAIPPPPGAPK